MITISNCAAGVALIVFAFIGACATAAYVARVILGAMPWKRRGLAEKP